MVLIYYCDRNNASLTFHFDTAGGQLRNAVIFGATYLGNGFFEGGTVLRAEFEFDGLESKVFSADVAGGFSNRDAA